VPSWRNESPSSRGSRVKTRLRIHKLSRSCRPWQWILCLMVLLLATAPAAAATPIPKPSGLVNDFAGVLSPEDERRINSVVSELLQKTEIPVVVVTMADIGGADSDDYANRLYESWGIGKKGVDKGVLLFVAVRERKMRIEVGYGLEGVIPDGLAGEVRDSYMIPYLREDRFGPGLLNGAAALAGIIAQAEGVELTGEVRPAAPPRDRKRGFSFAPIIFIIIFVIIASRRRGGRGGSGWLLLPLLLGGGGRRGVGGSGGFGGFSGGFGGGMSGGGGAGGSF